MSPVEFQRLIREAVRYFTTHGYTSERDLDLWAERIATAANETLLSPEEAGEQIARHLGAVYDRMVGRLPRHLQQLHARTAVRMTPAMYFRRIETFPQLAVKMRRELDRRIAASADLIKIRRQEAMAATLRRFRGWASSVPPGGTPAPVGPQAKLINKEFRKIRFETNRLQIDQGHKLNSSLNATMAEGTGAIAAMWHSNWRQISYRFRPEHKERDEQVYTIRPNWALDRGLMKAGPAGYTDQITQPGEEVFCRCLPGSVLIPYANIEAVSRRAYDGVLVKITTAFGKSLSVTPNHPVLSEHGWRIADALNIGDYVVESIDQIVETQAENNEYHAIPSIREIFEFLAPIGRSCMAQGATDQFHGDGMVDCNVDIIFAGRPLRIDRKARFSQRGRQFRLSGALSAFSAVGSLRQHFNGFWTTSKQFAHYLASPFLGFRRLIIETYAGRFAHCSQWNASFGDPVYDCRASGVVFRGNDGRRDSGLVCFDNLLRRKIKLFAKVDSRLGFRANCDSSGSKPAPNGGVRDLKLLCKSNCIDPTKVRFGQIIQIDRYSFSGHVYNLQTTDGWYVSDGIVTHNCHYSYIYNLDSLPDEMLTDKGRKALKSMEDMENEAA